MLQHTRIVHKSSNCLCPSMNILLFYCVFKRMNDGQCFLQVECRCSGLQFSRFLLRGPPVKSTPSQFRLHMHWRKFQSWFDALSSRLITLVIRQFGPPQSELVLARPIPRSQRSPDALSQIRDIGSSLACVACNDVESHAIRVSVRRLTTT